MSDRSQRVRVNEDYSGNTAVRSGIPQGSILGPILFTIFINDLPKDIDVYCKLFADDTKVLDGADRKDSIQKDLDKLQEWSELWQLLFNVDKCKVLHMGKNNPNNVYFMRMNDEIIEIKACTEEKDLGVTFDSNLLFDRHIVNCVNKANGMIGIIKRTFSYLDKETFLMLYKAIVRPHLEYGNIIWAPLFKRQSAAVERVQRRATKILKECKDMSYGERLRFLNLHSLKGRRVRGDLIETFKIYHGYVDLDWDLFFTTPTLGATRGSEGKVFIEQYRTNLRKNVFSNRVAPYWNRLKTDFKQAKSVNNFKNLLDADPNFRVLFYGFDE